MVKEAVAGLVAAAVEVVTGENRPIRGPKAGEDGLVGCLVVLKTNFSALFFFFFFFFLDTQDEQPNIRTPVILKPPVERVRPYLPSMRHGHKHGVSSLFLLF